MRTLHYTDNWDFYPSRLANLPYSVRYDTGVEHMDDITRARFPHTLELIIDAMIVETNGFPVDAEFKRINTIEDNFSTGKWEIYLMGIVTGGGSVRYVFCLTNDAAEDADEIVEHLMGDAIHDKHDFKLFIEDRFGYYYEYLYPNEFERSWIANRHICNQMHLDGEKFVMPREIDFYCTFESTQHMSIAAAELLKMGFKEHSRSANVNGYVLRFTIFGIPDFNWINAVTTRILELVHHSDGEFDGWSCPVLR
ncbi:MAG: DUF695 domain-containing protein [Defluviitaleaceae bacterium]|nr:DUF695 domain-containing protein [Defluviitaleaceae bacterium]